MSDSDVEMGSSADIGNRRLRMDQELATTTRGRVQLVECIKTAIIEKLIDNIHQYYKMYVL
jgi:hypothetical protein